MIEQKDLRMHWTIYLDDWQAKRRIASTEWVAHACTALSTRVCLSRPQGRRRSNATAPSLVKARPGGLAELACAPHVYREHSIIDAEAMLPRSL